MSAEEKIGIEIKSNLKETKDQLKQVDSQLAKLNNQKASIQIRAEKLQNAKTEIAKVNVQLKELAAKKATIKADASNINDAKKKIAEINTQMDKLRMRKATLQVTTEKLKGADKDLKNLDTQMRNLSKQQAVLNVRAEGLEQAESKLGRIKDALRKMPAVAKEGFNFSGAVSNIGNQLDSVSNKMLSFLNPFTSKLNQMIGLGAVFNAMNAAVNTVKNSVGGAIDRFDTLRQFPKVLGELGVSAQEAAKSKDMLLEGIDGLPTRLNEISSTAQRMYTSFGSMEKATQTANALNNSLLGSGSDAEKAARGTEQYLKVLQSGKMEMDSWNTLSETMDVGLVKIAESFGYVGKSAKKDLYDALSSGAISIDQFNDKMIELGAETESVMGKLARETTKGVATSTKNLQTAVVNGLEGLLGKVDEASKKLTGKDIAENIASLKPLIGKAFTAVGDQLDKFFVFLDQNKDKIGVFFKNAKETINENIGEIDTKAFLDGLKDSGTMVVNTFRTIFEASKPLIAAGKMILESLGGGSVEKGLARTIGLYASFAISAKALSGPLKILGKLTNIKMPSFFGGKGGGVDATTFEAFKGNMFDGLMSLGKKAGNMALILGAIKLVEAAAEAMKQVDEKVPSDFGSLVTKIGAMTVAIGAMGGLAFIASKVPNKDMFSGLAVIALISADLMIAAEALRQINEKVPGSFGEIVPKLKNMGLALVGMGALVTAAGFLATLSPITAVAGLAAVTALSAELLLTAETLRQIDEKVPNDMKDIGKKIGSITVAIGGMGALATAVGAFVATGIGGVGLVAGLASIALISAELILVSESLKQVDEKIPNDMPSVKKKIRGIVSIIEYMTNADMGGMIATFKNTFKGFNVSSVSNVLKKMAEVGDSLLKMPEIKSDKALQSVKEIQKVINSLSDGDGFVEKIKKIAKSFIDDKEVKAVEKYISSLESIATKLKTFKDETIDWEPIEGQVKGILGVLSKMTFDKEFSKKILSEDTIKKVNNTVDLFINMIGKLQQLNTDIDLNKVGNTARKIQSSIVSLGFQNKDQLKTMLSEKEVNKVNRTVDLFIGMIGKFSQMNVDFDINKVGLNITKIKSAITQMGFPNNEQLKALLTESQVNLINRTVDLYVGTIGKLQQLNSEVDFNNLGLNITRIKSAITQLGFPNKETLETLLSEDQVNKVNRTVDLFVITLGKLTQLAAEVDLNNVNINVTKIKSAIMQLGFPNKETLKNLLSENEVGKVNRTVDLFIGMLSRLQELNYELDLNNAGLSITKIKSLIVRLGFENKKQLSTLLTEGEITKINNAITALLGFRDNLQQLAQNPIDPAVMIPVIDNVKAVITQINNFPSADGLEGLVQLVESFKQLVKTLDEISPEFEPVGKKYGENVIKGFTNADIAGAFKSIINKVVSTLDGKTLKDKFYNVGKGYGDEVNKGFGQGIANMAGKIDSQISNLNSKARQFSGLGNSFGMLLANSFDAQIQNLSNSTSQQIEAIQLSLNKLRLPNLTPSRSSNAFDNAMTLSTGGLVEPQYRASGGVIFQPKGTDTVPIMGTPGEYMHNTNAVKTFGLDFMNRVNSLDLKGTYQAFTNRFANKLATQPIMNTVNNNTYNNQTTNNNPRVNQYVNGSNASHGIRHIKRYLKKL